MIAGTLYQGKRIDTKEWVCGYYYCLHDTPGQPHMIKVYDFSKEPMHQYVGDYEVDAKTIRRETGLHDKNGTKIFEWDILNAWDSHNPLKPEIKYITTVEFGNPNGQYDWGWQLVFKKPFDLNPDILCWVEMQEGGAYCEIIGNKFDNPELLEEK